MVEAIKFAHESIKIQCKAQEKLAKTFGKKETREYDPEEEDEYLMKKVHEFTYDKCYEVAKKGLSKSERGIAFDARDIIRQERLIELSFEGNRYNDLRRWKLAEEYFNSPVFGWSVNETTVSGYYNITQVGIRSFNYPRDYFHPISINEITINPNLIQNPGW